MPPALDPQLRGDALALVAFVVVGGWLAVRFELVGRLAAWFSQYDYVAWQQSSTLLVVLLLGVLVFLSRRVIALRRVVRNQQRCIPAPAHSTEHDPVTDLPNRQVWKRRLAQEFSRGKREGKNVALIALDIDRFRQINEVFGHDAGDDLLREMATRLSSVIRDMDTLIRMGADEFLIIQPGLENLEGARILAARLQTGTTGNVQINGQSVPVSMSIGVAVSSFGNRDGANLLRQAHIALERARQAGGAVFRFHEADMDTRLQERQRLERDLRLAIDMNELVLHYQPLFNVNDQKLLGFEALLRWPHAERGFISPVEFIPIAEETGLIMGLGEWVLEQACSDALKWAGARKIAVNLSPIQFRDPDLPAKIAAIIERTGLPPERLELEVTEGVLIEDADIALSMLVELKALGVRISMDDFGTGYSSLSYLKRFPFDKIKIDRSFVSQLESDSEDAAIVRAILAMGHSLGMIATAEGVESAEQLDYLQLEGCDEAQGFLLGKPMAFEYALALCSVPDSAAGPLAMPWVGNQLPLLVASNR